MKRARVFPVCIWFFFGQRWIDGSSIRGEECGAWACPAPCVRRCSQRPGCAAATLGGRGCRRDSSVIPESELVLKVSFKTKIRRGSSFMPRLRYFPKLPAGQKNKKSILNSILLNFATGDFSSPREFGKIPVCVASPSSASLLPLFSSSETLQPQPVFSSSCLHPEDMSGHWSPHPRQLWEGKGKSRQPHNQLPLPFPLLPPVDV